MYRGEKLIILKTMYLNCEKTFGFKSAFGFESRWLLEMNKSFIIVRLNKTFDQSNLSDKMTETFFTFYYKKIQRIYIMY